MAASLSGDLRLYGVVDVFMGFIVADGMEDAVAR
jgi:hypothetical protein